MARPPVRNPLRRLPAPTLPPGARSRASLRLTAAAAEGRFELPVCVDCGAVQYPPREACHGCLSVKLAWRLQTGLGELIAETTLFHSNEIYFRQRLPWRLGLVRLEAGPTIVAHLHGGCAPAPTRVRLRACLDKSGQAALVALPPTEITDLLDDKMMREMTCDPNARRILVTDGKHTVGPELVRALVAAGAERVFVGNGEPLADMPQVVPVRLDLTDSESVRHLAVEIGGKVDILINTAEYHRPAGIADRRGLTEAAAEMDINYFGLLRLAQMFAPAMRARAADRPTSAAAWVNLLSVYALSNLPAHGTFSASKAAAFSLSQCLRAEMQPAGIRVINIFAGPLNEEWNELIQPPKLAPAALARAIVQALRDGVEDVYPGEAAQNFIERFRESPKVLERELWER